LRQKWRPPLTAAAGAKRGRQAGMWAPSASIVLQSTVAVTANRLYMMKVCPSRAMVVTKIGFKVPTASGTDHPVDVGIVSAAGARVVSSGSVTGPAQLNRNEERNSHRHRPCSRAGVLRQHLREQHSVTPVRQCCVRCLRLSDARSRTVQQGRHLPHPLHGERNRRQGFGAADVDQGVLTWQSLCCVKRGGRSCPRVS
jgi:hypothetical protein